MKKRMIAAICAVLMLCLLTACGGSKATPVSGDSMAGTYALVDAEGESADTIMKLKDGISLEVRGDNTGTLSLMNNVEEIRFDPSTKLCGPDGGKQVPFCFDGKQLSLKSDDFTMIFEKQ